MPSVELKTTDLDATALKITMEIQILNANMQNVERTTIVHMTCLA